MLQIRKCHFPSEIRAIESEPLIKSLKTAKWMKYFSVFCRIGGIIKSLKKLKLNISKKWIWIISEENIFEKFIRLSRTNKGTNISGEKWNWYRVY